MGPRLVPACLAAAFSRETTSVLTLAKSRHPRCSSTRWAVWGLAAAALLGVAVEGAFASEQFRGLQVALTTGERLRPDRIDPAPDALVLVWNRSGIELRRRLGWERLTGVSYDGREIDLDVFRQAVTQLAAGDASAATPEFIPPGVPTRVRPVPPARYASFTTPGLLPEVAEPLPAPARVTHLAVDAAAANWDRDAATDGLIVFLEPRDAEGQPVATNGTVHCELLGFRPGYQDPGALLPRIGTWTKRLEADKRTYRGWRLQLPFQAIHPERRTDLASLGMLFVKLTVPGQGTFATTVDWLRLRQPSVIRDKLQIITGQRLASPESRFAPQWVP